MDIDFAITAISLSGIFSFILLLISIVMISFLWARRLFLWLQKKAAAQIISNVSAAPQKTQGEKAF